MIRFTYLALNIMFLLIAWLIVRRLNQHLVIRKTLIANQSAILFTGVVSYLLMVGFNTYLTILPIVRYSSVKLIGTYILSWPVEDIAYLIAGLYLIPALYGYWCKYYESNQTPTTSSKSESKSRGQSPTQKLPKAKSSRHHSRHI